MRHPPTWRDRFGTRSWSGGQATWSVGWVELPPPARASPPHVDVRQPMLRPNHLKPWLADQGVGPAGRPLSPLGLGSGPLGPRVKYTCGDDYFDIWSTSLCHPLKCSKLVPKFLKSNKH
jgi:hypothetical protein